MHLFIVVHGPTLLEGCGPRPQVLVVSITTIYPNIPHDAACVLGVGDHPFIRHPSFVFYRRMTHDDADHVSQMVNTGAWPENVPCDGHMLARVVQGVCASRLVARQFKKILGC